MHGKAVQKPQKAHGGKPQEDDKEMRPHGRDPEKEWTEITKIYQSPDVLASRILKGWRYRICHPRLQKNPVVL